MQSMSLAALIATLYTASDVERVNELEHLQACATHAANGSFSRNAR